MRLAWPVVGILPQDHHLHVIKGGVAGVKVNLLNAAGTVVGTQNTDGNGNYLFNSLTPGDYAVQFVAPTGFVFTAKDAGNNSNDAKDSDADPSTGKTVVTNLVSG